MKVKFQADADLKEVIVTATKRREPGIDFQTASAAGLEGLTDLQVLAVAAREGRILVTHDRRTMPSHFAEFIAADASSGVLIASQALPVPVVVEELLLIWSATEGEEWVNVISSIPL